MGARYVTWIDGQQAIVELVSREGEHVVARVSPCGDDGEPQEGGSRLVELETLGEVKDHGEFQVMLADGRSLGGHLTIDGKGMREVALAGSHIPVMALSERDAWLGAGAMGVDDGKVTVSMPGLVAKVLCEVGQQVEAGDPVLIIEAMKMENEVKAGRAGVVTMVHVAEGDRVEADILLLEVGEAAADG